MEGLFISAFNVSIAASFLVIAIIIFRLFAKGTPKWVLVLLWGMVGIRLALPFSIESRLSLIPSKSTVPSTITHDRYPALDTGFKVADEIINPVISGSMEAHPEYGANPMQILIGALGWIWLGVMVCMLTYMTLSFLYLRIKTGVSVRRDDGIYLSDSVKTPFILGVIKPKIFLPSDISEVDYYHVTAHERAHIKRLDHIWKPLGFILLSVYWFAPPLWVGYILLCRDIEAACDERVIRDFNGEEKAAYSSSLLSLGVKSRIFSACPLAFGETSVKFRITAISRYKKPTVKVIILSLTICAIFAACFLTYKAARSVAIDSGIWYAGKVIGDSTGNASCENVPHIVFNEFGNVLVESQNLRDLSYSRLGTMNTAYISKKGYDELLGEMIFREGYNEKYFKDNVRAAFRITPSVSSGIEQEEIYLLYSENELFMGFSNNEKINVLYKMSYNEPLPKYLYTTQYVSPDLVGASLMIDTENKLCRVTFGKETEYEASGTYVYENSRLTVTTTDTFAMKLVFYDVGNALVFDERNSETKGLSGLFPDGATFSRYLKLYGVACDTAFYDIDGDGQTEIIFINANNDGSMQYIIHRMGVTLVNKTIEFTRYDHITLEEQKNGLYLLCEYSEGDLGVYRYKVSFDGENLSLIKEE